MIKKTSDTRAMELFRLLHGKGDSGSESAFWYQNVAVIKGWMKLGKLVLRQEGRIAGDAQNPKLVWSSKKPTIPGRYWVRYMGQSKTMWWNECLELKRDKEGKMTQVFYGRPVPLSELPPLWGWQWAGPIPQPKEPKP